jgi:hypothetical protein
MFNCVQSNVFLFLIIILLLLSLSLVIVQAAIRNKSSNHHPQLNNNQFHIYENERQIYNERPSVSFMGGSNIMHSVIDK